MIKHFKENIISYIIAITTAIILFIYNNVIDTKLSISLNNKNGQIILENIGNNEIKITKVKALKYKANISFFRRPNIKNISEYFQKETKKAMNINNLLTIEDIEGLILSQNTSKIKQLISKPTQKGTFIAFDIPFEIDYESTSKWTNTIFNLFKYIGLINPKQFIFIRFDGCDFSEIGKKAYDERELNQDRIMNKLQDCIKKSKKFYALQQYIQNNSELNYIEFEKTLNKMNNQKLLTKTKKIIEKISAQSSGIKINYCYTTGFYINELKERNILTSKLYNNFVKNCSMYK